MLFQAQGKIDTELLLWQIGLPANVTLHFSYHIANGLYMALYFDQNYFTVFEPFWLIDRSIDLLIDIDLTIWYRPNKNEAEMSLLYLTMALCFDQNNDLKEENNFDQNIMPYCMYY